MDILFCTIATKYRLYQCIALYNSLRRQHPDAIMAVLCMDEPVVSLLEKASLPGMWLVPLEMLEDKELLEVKSERSLGEYCWTMKPVLIQYLFEKYEEAEIVAYMDSDLYFFDDPAKLLKKDWNWNVIVTTHKINRKVNSGFLAFKRSRTTYRLLEWWRRKCTIWCYSRKEGHNYGDQGYLDAIRKIFYGVRYLDNPGVNIAPWNCHNYDFSMRNGKLYVNRCRLVFFHFSGFRIRKPGAGSIAFDIDVPCEVCGAYLRDIVRGLELVNSIDCEMTDNFYMGI